MKHASVWYGGIEVWGAPAPTYDGHLATAWVVYMVPWYHVYMKYHGGIHEVPWCYTWGSMVVYMRCYGGIHDSGVYIHEVLWWYT